MWRTFFRPDVAELEHLRNLWALALKANEPETFPLSLFGISFSSLSTQTHTHTHTLMSAPSTYLLGSDYKVLGAVKEMPLRKAAWEVELLAVSPNLFTPLHEL